MVSKSIVPPIRHPSSSRKIMLGNRTRFAHLSALILAGTTPAASQQLAIVGGDLYTISNGVIPEGTVLIRDGKITQLGVGIAIPSNVEVVDASGLTVTPGFIDARSALGVPPAARIDRQRLIRGDVLLSESLGPLRVPGAFGQADRAPALHPWLRGGVTAVYVSPGPQNLVGGFGAVVKLTDEGLGEVLRETAGLAVSFGDAAQQTFEAPTTRQGMVQRLRQWLVDSGESASPRIALVLAGEIPVRVVANIPDDIVTAQRIAREFNLALVIDVAAGAHEVAGALARDGVAVVVGPSMIAAGGGGAMEMFAHTAENAARLHEAGVTVALSTDAASGRSVVMEAVVARTHGLPPEAALRAVTLDAARILGVDDRIGSIQAGKDADLVIWDGDPVGTWGEARVVVVNGRVVFRR
jgi:hypothetical protein